MEFSTGDVAHAAAVSEKTVRLYADRGLVVARRSDAGARLFDSAALGRVQQIVALRRVELSLAEIADVLAAADSVAAFDEVWSGRRTRFVDLVEAGEHARDALLEKVSPSNDPGALPPVSFHDSDGHLRLSLAVLSDLPRLPERIAAATAELFATVQAAEVALVDHPYVEYPERITLHRPGRVLVHIPLAESIAPEGEQYVSRRAACTEAVVQLDPSQARDQHLIVRVHDLLSRRRFSDTVSITGSTREVYFPSFGDPAAVGIVMEVRAPIELPASPHAR